MKLNTDEDSPHYWARHFGRDLKIMLDGVPLHHVIEADDAEGYVVVYEYENGVPKIDAERKAVATQRVLGEVKFVGVLLNTPLS